MSKTNYFYLLFYILFIQVSFGQTSDLKKAWTVEFQRNNAFIENKGQFNISKNSLKDVLFAIDHGHTMIYFHKTGVSYKFIREGKLERNEKEREEALIKKIERKSKIQTLEEYKAYEDDQHKKNFKTEFVNIEFQNSNTDIQIFGLEETSDYHSYNIKQNDGTIKNVNYIRGYKKIVYKNVYPKIDIEFSFTEKAGLKYAVILHPGANPNLVKMLYDKPVQLKENGDLHINSDFGDIIDHAPLSYYDEYKAEIIKTNFIIQNNTVSFKLGSYDITKKLIIDPWTQTPAFATNWDCVWECERDGAGNVYIIGGVNPMQLLKFNSAGVLQWTYNTPYDTSSWLGTFATDLAGNSYVTQGSTAAIQKVSTTGSLLWNNGSPGGVFSSSEFWNITFNCDQTKLIVGGTGGTLPPLPYIYQIDMSNGNVSSSLQVTPGNLTPTQEVRSICSSKNGKYYFLTHDTVGYINQSFSSCGPGSSAMKKATNSYSFGYKCENYRYDNSGIMAIRSNGTFLFTHRGDRLDKRSLATGAIIASATIPGGTFSSGFGGNSVQNSGIDVDDCGNVYVGSKNQVVKFDGNTLAQLSTYATSFNVYDVHVNTGGEIIACGSTGNSGNSSRTGYIQSITAGACNSISLTCCDASICQPANQCVNNSPIQLQTSTTGGTWSGTGVNSTGVFSPSTAGVGTHTVVYTLACGSESITITVSSCSLNLCQNSGSITASGGASPYTWASTTTSISCASCPFGNCVPLVCAGTAVPTWTASGSTITAPASGTFPIKVTDGSGVTYTITSLASLPSCTTPTCNTINVSITTQSNVSCFNGNNGSATLSSSGGTGAYSYTWSPGNLSGATQTSLTAGIYTINVKDANNCPGTRTISITQPSIALTGSITSSTPANCGQNNGAASVSASGGTPAYSYSWIPNGGTNNSSSTLAAGNYTLRITDSKGCNANVPVSITNTGGPSLTFSGITNVSCFGGNNGSATASSSGGTAPYTYTWNPGNLSGATQSSLSAGNYTISTRDASGCVGTNTINITQPASALTANINTSPTSCGSSSGSATVTANGGTPAYTYSWTSGQTTNTLNNLGVGNYSVTVTDSKNCTVTIGAIINSDSGPTISVASQTNVSCANPNSGAAEISATGGTGSYTYTWIPAGGNNATATGLSAGSYTIVVSDGTCDNITTLQITENNTFSVSVNSEPTICSGSVGSATVNVIGGTSPFTYNWSNGNTTNVAQGLSSGNYTVTVTDDNGCVKSATINIFSTNVPFLVDAGISVIIPSGGSTILNGSTNSNTTFTWSPASSLDNPNSLTPVANPNQTTTYTLSVTDQNGCKSSDTVTVYLELPCGELYVPTAFSPNGDGQNDILYVYGNCVSDLTFAIYDRWGEKIFETNTVNTGWDGTFKGKKLNPAVFAYYLKGIVDGKEVLQHGSITLVK